MFVISLCLITERVRVRNMLHNQYTGVLSPKRTGAPQNSWVLLLNLQPSGVEKSFLPLGWKPTMTCTNTRIQIRNLANYIFCHKSQKSWKKRCRLHVNSSSSKCCWRMCHSHKQINKTVYIYYWLLDSLSSKIFLLVVMICVDFKLLCRSHRSWLEA